MLNNKDNILHFWEYKYSSTQCIQLCFNNACIDITINISWLNVVALLAPCHPPNFLVLEPPLAVWL